MREWQSQSHVRWYCRYHVVWVPKYRKRAIFGQTRSGIGRIIRELCQRPGVELVEGLGFKEDDVLTVPITIAQRAVVAGTVFFPVAQELLAETRIEAYTVSLIDTFDRESMKEVLLLTEETS